MDIRIETNLRDKLAIKHTHASSDIDVLVFEFANKCTIVAYSDVSVITTKRNVTTMKVIVNATDNIMVLRVTKNTDIFIYAPIVNIFENEDGEICFYPIQEYDDEDSNKEDRIDAKDLDR